MREDWERVSFTELFTAAAAKDCDFDEAFGLFLITGLMFRTGGPVPDNSAIPGSIGRTHHRWRFIRDKLLAKGLLAREVDGEGLKSLTLGPRLTRQLGLIEDRARPRK